MQLASSVNAIRLVNGNAEITSLSGGIGLNFPINSDFAIPLTASNTHVGYLSSNSWVVESVTPTITESTNLQGQPTQIVSITSTHLTNYAVLVSGQNQGNSNNTANEASNANASALSTV